MPGTPKLLGCHAGFGCGQWHLCSITSAFSPLGLLLPFTTPSDAIGLDHDQILLAVAIAVVGVPSEIPDLIASIATVDDIASVAGADLIVATVGINQIPTGTARSV